MRDDRDTFLIIAGGILAGLFGIYWLVRGLWWIGPKIIFVGLPIIALSLLVSGFLSLWVESIDEHIADGIRFRTKSFRKVILAQGIFVFLVGAFILTHNVELRFNEQGQELGKVIQYPSIHHAYNDFAAAWQKASPYQAQSEERYRTELFDLWYVELILILSGILGPAVFLFFSRKSEEDALSSLKSMVEERIDALNEKSRADLKNLKDRHITEKDQQLENYRELKTKNNTLESEIRRLKAKDEFTKKDRDKLESNGSLEADVF